MRQKKSMATYITTNASRRPFYTGVTGRLEVRAWQHKLKRPGTYTAKYNLTRLVYYELHANPGTAIEREKEIKGWSRAKKIALVESVNPKWDDLARDWNKIWRPETPGSFARVSRAEESAREPSLAQDDVQRVGRGREPSAAQDDADESFSILASKMEESGP